MNEEEARGLLGFEQGTAHDQLRRAYLRAVKKHPPERDPDGFRRVREAYELLDHLEADEAFTMHVEAAQTPPPTEEHDPLEAFRRRAEGASRPRQRKIWREAVEAHPKLPEPRWQLYWSSKSASQAAEVAVQAFRDGHEEFVFQALAAPKPEALPPEIWIAARNSDDPRARLALLGAMLRAGRLVQADVLLHDILRTSAHDREAPLPMARTCIELIARLVGTRRVPRARVTLEAIQRWLEATGIERHWLPPLQGQWLLLCELVATAGDLPRKLRRSLAKVVLRGTIGEACLAAASLDRSDAERTLNVLAERGPELFKILGQHLERAGATHARVPSGPNATRPNASSSQRGGAAWGIFATILIGVVSRAVMSSGSKSSDEELSSGAKDQMAFDSPDVRSFMKELPPSVAREARQLVQAIDEHACARARRHATALSLKLPENPTPTLVLTVKRTSDGLTHQCAEYGPLVAWLAQHDPSDGGLVP
jgi:hypothetical protein